MPYRPRARRVAIDGARVRVADTTANLVNVSLTGALIQGGRPLLPARDCTVVLELKTVVVRLTAIVVRCVPADVPAQFVSALAFVRLSGSTRAVLRSLCGPEVDSSGGGARLVQASDDDATPHTVGRRLGRRLRFSMTRCCPMCGSRAVRKPHPFRYVCMDCGRGFVGVQIGGLRIAL